MPDPTEPCGHSRPVHRITVQYATPAAPAAFDRHFLETHVGLVLEVPGLRAFTWSKPQPLGGEVKVYLVAQLDFADTASLASAMSSPEMAAAGKDAAGLGVPMTMFAGEVAVVL
jgi:uncharacterized protein (TIGR02118 family)